MFEKSVRNPFTPFSISALQRDTLRSTISALPHRKAQPTNVPNFIPSGNLSTRYLLPNFVDGIESVSDKVTDKTVNDIACHRIL